MGTKQLRPKVDQAVSSVSAKPALVGSHQFAAQKKTECNYPGFLHFQPGGLTATWHILGLGVQGLVKYIGVYKFAQAK
jgi:hypothetical protein